MPNQAASVFAFLLHNEGQMTKSALKGKKETQILSACV